ncbi:hypothetical protein HPP92_004149 [Vanilla planifolia]|uniref:EF-hand domain-containing protein n=1 Tax=Vanilla planifolia TaxID=51239 RepID=A0A835S8W2_VANPL|nr:hypothetical protein HPP92_004149 [Vanilla planifolia]
MVSPTPSSNALISIYLTTHLLPSVPRNSSLFSCLTSWQPLGTMVEGMLEFEDFLPIIAEKLGEEGLIEELCNGFRLLMDPVRGLITFESLKQNAAFLGLDGMRDDEIRGMIREGDIDGDGALSEMEFCVLMVRLSPELMDESRRLFDEAFAPSS